MSRYINLAKQAVLSWSTEFRNSHNIRRNRDTQPFLCFYIRLKLYINYLQQGIQNKYQSRVLVSPTNEKTTFPELRSEHFYLKST